MSALIGLPKDQHDDHPRRQLVTYAYTVSNDNDEPTVNWPRISAEDAFTTASDACIDCTVMRKKRMSDHGFHAPR